MIPKFLAWARPLDSLQGEGLVFRRGIELSFRFKSISWRAGAVVQW